VSNTNYIPTPKSVELHLGSNPEFTRKYGAKVKAAGGRYTECRGHSNTRFVDLPWTDESRDLANKLIAEFGRLNNRTVVVLRPDRTFRGKHVHAPVVVHYVSQTDANPCGIVQEKYEAAFLKAFPEAAFPEPEVVKPPKPLAADLHLNSPAQFWAVLDALQQYIDNANDAEHLIDDAQIDEFKAKLRAAEQFRDQLDAVLASLAEA
jgi:hypothetical protein